MKFQALIVTLLLLAACAKPPVPIPDGNGNEQQQDDPAAYAGSWDYTKIIMENGSLGIQGQEFGTFEGVGKDIVGSVEVNADNMRFIAELEYTAELTLDVFGQQIPQDMPVAKRTIEGDWDVENGEISLSADDGSDIRIISSTPNKVIFTGEFSETVGFGQFNFDAVSDVEITIEK